VTGVAVLEKFVVQTTIEAEVEPYHKIVEDVLTDLSMAGMISRIHVTVRPEDSLFILAAVIRAVMPEVRVSDIAEVSEGRDEGTVLIELTEEKHLPQLLEALWENYGRGHVSQPERRTIVAETPDPETELDTIRDMVVDDPHMRLKTNLADMAIRASPEGFRVRYHSLEGRDFIFVATEEQMKQEWIEEAGRLLEELKKE
jgi:putative methanogenesis marker protein 17